MFRCGLFLLPLTFCCCVAGGGEGVDVAVDGGVVDAGVADAGVGGPNDGDAGVLDAGVDARFDAVDGGVDGGVDAGTVEGIDADVDGLDDDVEAQLARDYLPFLSDHPDDGCPRSGVVFRARPHPADPVLVSVIYSRLYEEDCGLTSHVGDNEAFGVTIDPRAAAPAGLVAITAISHQNTVCERVTTCGQCSGLDACDTVDVAGTAWPVLYASKDKHAGVVDVASACSTFGSCFDRCSLNERNTVVPLANVGEPAAPLIDNLTAAGFITAANGWTAAELFDFDPWSDIPFGDAGRVSGDLVDDAFLAPACAADGVVADVEEFVVAADRVSPGPLCAVPANAADVVDAVDVSCELEVDNSIAPASPLTPPLLRVVTWNVRFGIDHAAVLQALETDEVLRAADVLLLSEVARGDGDSNPVGINQARLLAMTLGFNYAFAVEWDRRFADVAARAGEHGVAVLSRFPIGNLTALRHTPANDWWDEDRLLGGRVTLGATLIVGTTPVRVYSTHLCTRPLVPNDDARAVQGAEIRADANRSGRPALVVVGGDFNTWTCNPLTADCTAAPAAEDVVVEFYIDGWSDGTAGFTGPTQLGEGIFPQRLDWIFHRGGDVEVGARVDVGGSDHFPLFTSLLLTASAP